MFRPIQELLQQILREYADGPGMNTLLSAKREYLSLAGSVHDDSEEFESKMSCFNDWFLFNYIPDQTGKNIVSTYLEKHEEIDGAIRSALLSINYSIFEYKKISFRKQIILTDLLHNQSVALSKIHGPISVLEKDLFIGRIMTYLDNCFLLDGICMLPQSAKSAVSKQCKKVRKQKDPKKEIIFLLNLESLKTKCVRFGHVDIEKIFVF